MRAAIEVMPADERKLSEFYDYLCQLGARQEEPKAALREAEAMLRAFPRAPALA